MVSGNSGKRREPARNRSEIPDHLPPSTFFGNNRPAKGRGPVASGGFGTHPSLREVYWHQSRRQNRQLAAFLPRYGPNRGILPGADTRGSARAARRF